jgi:hypothetical protein
VRRRCASKRDEISWDWRQLHEQALLNYPHVAKCNVNGRVKEVGEDRRLARIREKEPRAGCS